MFKKYRARMRLCSPFRMRGMKISNQPLVFAKERFVNPGFEDDWTGWTHASEEISEDKAHSGIKSMRGFFTTGWIQQLFSEPYPKKQDVKVFEYWAWGNNRGILQVIYNAGTLSAGMQRIGGVAWNKTNILTNPEWINNIPAGATIEGVKYTVGPVVDWLDDFLCIG